MKKHVLIILIMFCMIAAIAGAAVNTQYFGKSPSISISLTKQEPDPVEPGKEVEVTFKLDNNGTVADNVLFEIMPEYPFSLVPGESPSRNVGVLGTSQEDKQAVNLKFKLKAAQEAVDGNHEIKVRYKSDNYDSWIILENLKIKVQTHDAILSIDNFIEEPSVTTPGSKTTLTILLKNYASSFLKDIKISLDLGRSSDTSTPFSPVGSTNEKVISYLEPQSTEALEFELLVDPDAASKSYKIPITLKYSDSLNKAYNKTNIITLVVGGEPDISVGIDSATIYTSGSAGEITVKIVNKGLPDMKFVNVYLGKGDKHKVLSPSEVYIGNIDSDDYETANFKIYVGKVSEDKLILPLTVEYKDANNKDYKKSVNLELPLYSSSEAKRLGLVKGNGKFSWVLILVLVVALFFAYRVWKKRGRKHN